MSVKSFKTMCPGFSGVTLFAVRDGTVTPDNMDICDGSCSCVLIYRVRDVVKLNDGTVTL
jgi:hypothetical protein